MKCILRHGLVYRFNAVTHCEFIHYLLSCLIKIHLPGIISFGIRDLHHPIPLHICEMVKEVLKHKTGLKVYVRLMKPSSFMKSLELLRRSHSHKFLCSNTSFFPPYPLHISFLLEFSQLNFLHVYLRSYPADTVNDAEEVHVTMHERCMRTMQRRCFNAVKPQTSFLKPTHVCPQNEMP